jgi:hypothetical protein
MWVRTYAASVIATVVNFKTVLNDRHGRSLLLYSSGKPGQLSASPSHLLRLSTTAETAYHARNYAAADSLPSYPRGAGNCQKVAGLPEHLHERRHTRVRQQGPRYRGSSRSSVDEYTRGTFRVPQIAQSRVARKSEYSF